MAARCLLACATLLLLLIGAGCASLPSQGPGRGWIYRHGGRVDPDRHGDLVARARALLDRLRPHCRCEGLSISVLDEDPVAAWSWPDGSLFVTRGLLQQMNDAQVIAALAHEIGHLDASAGGQQGEHRADASGCALLEDSGVGSQAMLRMLETLRATAAPTFEPALARRESALRQLLAQGEGPLVR